MTVLADWRSVSRPSIPGSQMSSSTRSKGVLGDLLQALLAARNRFGGEAFVLEDAFQRLPDAGLVVDNEDSWHTGNSITKRVPRGKFGSTPM